MKYSQSWLTGLFRPATDYRLASRLFIKFLALIYLAAFLSLTGQITGLIGSEGILPLQEQLESATRYLGGWAWLQLPTLFWIDSSDAVLQATAWLGCIFAVLLFFGTLPRLMLLSLFVLYLSLATASQLFLNFQWDYLLLESGFLAIFLIGGPSRLILLMLHWLLFRLRFMSGIGKLASGDPSWSNLTALNHYFETQPLPHIGSWYAHQLPELLLQAGVLLTLFTELIVPFFIFLPRRWRLAAAFITIGMQLFIIATSNHNFFNLLTIALCLLLLDDDFIKRFTAYFGLRIGETHYQNQSPTILALSAAGALLIFSSSIPLLLRNVAGVQPGKEIIAWSDRVRRYGIGNAYHVFPTMQTERIELIIEASMDGNDWHPYVLPWQPVAVDRAPAFLVPHQPRLDWMMWFVPTQQPPGTIILDRLINRLAEGSEAVNSLFASVPFNGSRPNYFRVPAYRYRFTNAEERSATGAWWIRERLGTFPWIPARNP